MTISFTFIQTILVIFLLFAESRVYLRFKGGALSFIGLIFWSLIFNTAIIIVVFPVLTSEIANKLGIGRGVDLIIYTSIVLLFYLVFRLYIFIEDLRQEITELVKKLALKETLNKNEKKASKN